MPPFPMPTFANNQQLSGSLRMLYVIVAGVLLDQLHACRFEEDRRALGPVRCCFPQWQKEPIFNEMSTDQMYCAIADVVRLLCLPDHNDPRTAWRDSAATAVVLSFYRMGIIEWEDDFSPGNGTLPSMMALVCNIGDECPEMGMCLDDQVKDWEDWEAAIDTIVKSFDDKFANGRDLCEYSLLDLVHGPGHYLAAPPETDVAELARAREIHQNLDAIAGFDS